MDKYRDLKAHLEGIEADSWVASFEDIEKATGFRLPSSARKYDAWWGNTPIDGRHSASWLSAGWRVEDVNLRNGWVKFQRVAVPSLPSSSKSPIARNAAAVVPPLEWDTVQELSFSLKMQWNPIGRVILGENSALIFPAAPAVAAIYRFRIRGINERLYIGETSNLNRRFGNYRSPGPTQQTSLRINGELLKALSEGAEVAIAAVTTGAWIETGGVGRPADLSSKAVRCMFENAALVAAGAEARPLNRAISDLEDSSA